MGSYFLKPFFQFLFWITTRKIEKPVPAVLTILNRIELLFAFEVLPLAAINYLLNKFNQKLKGEN